MAKFICIGDVPMEWFTGVGELRSHDRLGNDLTYKDVLFKPQVKRAPGYTRAKVTARSKAMSTNCTHTLINNGVKSTMVEGILNKKDITKYGNYGGYSLIKYLR